MTFGDIGSRQHNFRTHRTKMCHLFIAHLVGHDDGQLVSLECTDQRECDTSIACSCFDDSATWFQLSRLLRRSDHRNCDAIFDRLPWIEILQLHKKFANPSINLADLEHRRIADHVEQAGINWGGRGGGHLSSVILLQ